MHLLPLTSRLLHSSAAHNVLSREQSPGITLPAASLPITKIQCVLQTVSLQSILHRSLYTVATVEIRIGDALQLLRQYEKHRSFRKEVDGNPF